MCEYKIKPKLTKTKLINNRPIESNNLIESWVHPGVGSDEVEMTSNTQIT